MKKSNIKIHETNLKIRLHEIKLHLKIDGLVGENRLFGKRSDASATDGS
jgi:hypothetical protein